MVIHTTMATRRLKREVTWSVFPSMFWNLNRQRHRWNYLRGMEFAADVEGYMESWRDESVQNVEVDVRATGSWT